ncbi:hypothetical protein FEM48_Zijuj04G0182700 [Ziziphus jujuba var. spinosa]|nr:hypothetical protein FEM48_Zijuj04G0182700 [Ziziphus jujuba var. spinosa]
MVEELRKLCQMGVPMVVVTVSQFLLQVVSLMMAGHLGEISLSGVAIATSFADVTGFSVLLGMAGALETLCGQTFGAEQYDKLGNYTFCSIITLLFVCLPVSLLWIFMEKILVLFGQDPSISHIGGKYCIFLIPALFGYAILQSLVRYFQSQSLIFPMVATSCAVLVLHVPLCWVMVFKLGLGITGAALSIGISYWVSVVGLGLYVKYSSACEKTRVHVTMDALRHVGEFVRFAIPSAVMVCLEWASFELLVLLSGFLPNAELETSVLSVCLNTTTLHFYIPYGIGAAASTRVSNELGAGNSKGAQVAMIVVMIVAVGEAAVVSTILYCCRYVLGYGFSNEKEVVDYVAEMVPLLCLSITSDSLLAVLSGIVRGSGWQDIAAYVNLGAYYGVGVPLSTLLAFVFHLRGKGLWFGVLTGSVLQAIVLSLITFFTNWQKQADKARERIFQETLPADFKALP